MRRRALLIGCQTADLSGPDNDVRSMACTLADHGFACERCTGADATQAGILARLEAFTGETRAGDAVVLFYSGHGGSTMNWHGRRERTQSPLVPPRYQYIVPVDFIEEGRFRGILDIELSWALARLTARTPNVTVLLDCCFATSQFREAAPGMQVREKAIGKRDSKGDCAHILKRLEALRLDPRPRPLLDPEHNPDAVILAASPADKTAKELQPGRGDAGGAFTWGLVDALRLVRGRRVTWVSLLAKVQAYVARHVPGQQPTLVGPGQRVLFELDEAPAVGAVTIDHDESGYFLRGGSLLGIGEGDRFAIVEPDVQLPLPGSYRTIATTTAVEPTRARVRIEGPPPACGERALPLPSGHSSRGVALAVNPPMYEEIADELKKFGLLEARPADDPASFARVEREGDSFRITAHPPGRALEPVRDLDVLRDTLLRLQRAAIVLGLAGGREEHHLAARFAITWAPVVDGEIQAWRGAGDEPVVVDSGTRICVRLENQQKAPLFWTALDVDGEGSVEIRGRSGGHAIRVPGLEYELIGARPGTARVRGIELAWPTRAVGTTVRRDLVSVVASGAHDLRALSSNMLALAGARPPGLLDFVAPSKRQRMRGSGGDDEAPLRFAVHRLGFILRRRGDASA